MKKMSLVAAILAASFVGLSSFSSKDQPPCPDQIYVPDGVGFRPVRSGGVCDEPKIAQCKYYKDENGNFQPCDNEDGVYQEPPLK